MLPIHLIIFWSHNGSMMSAEKWVRILLCLCVVGIKWLQTRWMLKYIISLTFRTTLLERPHIFNIKRAETTHHGRKREWLLCPAICIPGSRSQRTKVVSLMPWKGLMRTQKHLDRSRIHSLISVPQICSKSLFPVASSRVKKMAQQSVPESYCCVRFSGHCCLHNPHFSINHFCFHIFSWTSSISQGPFPWVAVEFGPPALL